MPLQTLLNHHQVSRKEWDELVRSCPGGNIFQTPLMFEFFDEISRYEPLAVFMTDNGRLVGVCTCVVMREREKGWLGRLTSRAIIWGGPVVDENHPARNDIHTRLIDGIIHITRKKAIYTEFRNLFDLSIFQNYFMKRGFRFIPWLNFIVDTGSEQDVMKKISSGKIRQVKKGLKAGAEIIEPDDISQVRQFYNILEELYRTRVKKPLPPWEFFEKYFEFSLRSSEFRYLLVRFDEKIIGGMVCPVFGNKTIYEWFIAGNDASFREVYPSILATWAPIRYALDHGIGNFDFMGAGRPDRDYGVREFKSRFGGMPVAYGRYRRLNRPALFLLGKAGLKVWGFLRIK